MIIRHGGRGGGDTGRPDPCTWCRPGEAALLLVRGRTLATAAPIAAVVGTVLALVNQGGLIAGGHADASTWARVALNYLVPFCVASYGYLAARRVHPYQSSPATSPHPW